ncbi:MAG: hypothetical protein OEZ16_08285 [Chromatiales bacterium]|nr:hypothetical protein [Chromatiales bacterium]
MKLSQRVLIHTALFTTLLVASAASQAKIICWKNSDGIRECGNSVPPEYAQKPSEVLNERGMTTEIRGAAKTPEELKAEREQLAKEKAQEVERENYDRVLLATYLSEEDIIRSNTRQTATVDATIDVTHSVIKKLNTRLEEEQKKADGYEKKGKPVPIPMQQEIDTLKEQIADKTNFIETKEDEKRKLKEKFTAEIKRFRELKGIKTSQ